MNSLLRSICVSFLLAALPAAAGDIKTIDIPAGDLTAALELLAKQSGVELVYRPEQLKGLHTKGVQGELSSKEAVTRLLEGTALTLRTDPSGVLLITESSPPLSGNAKGTGIDLAQAGDAGRSTQSSGAPAAEENTAEPAARGVPELLVKGKRSLNTDIQRTEDDTQPYVVFNAEDIARSGAANVEEFLRSRLPMNTQMFSAGQQNTSFGSEGRIDLRGLGADETLILVDGRRMARVGVAFTDGLRQPSLSGIAPASIERIEILPATSGGIYGGSATAGVINIILKRNYTGLDFQAVYGNTFDSDVGRTELSASGGFALEGGRTRIMLSAAYADRNMLIAADRDFTRLGRELQFRNNPSMFSFPIIGYTSNIASADGSNLVLKPAFGGTALGSPITHAPVGYAGPASDSAAGLVANAGRFSFDPPATGFSTLQPSRTQSASLSVRRDFGASIEAFLELGADRDRGSSSGAANFFLAPAASSPNNPFEQDIWVHFVVPTLPVVSERELKTRFARGGAIARLPGGWTASLEYSWNATASSFDTVFAPALTGAGYSYLESVALRDPNAFPLDLSSYYATPPFVELTGPFDASLDDAILRLSGPVLRLPAGPVVLAGYIEQREEQVEDSFRQEFSGSLTWWPRKSQDVQSAYLEARAPIFSPAHTAAFARELELMVAVRRDEYESRSVPGTGRFDVPSREGPFPAFTYAVGKVESTDYTIGLRYAPVADLTLRASYGTGFLPPSLGQITPEIFSTPAGAYGLTDPLRGDTDVTGTIAFVGGGSASVSPEESASLSYGLIFTPRGVQGLRFSADYTRIEKTDEITFIYPFQYWIDNEDRFPGRVVRGANLPGDQPGWAGPIVGMDVSLINVAAATVEAWDFQLDYEIRTARFGTWQPFAIATRQTRFERQTTPEDPTINTVGLSDGPVEWRGNFGVTWTVGAWTAGWNAQYIDSYSVHFSTNSPASNDLAELNQGASTIASRVYHDLFAGYRFGGSGGLFGSVLADTEITLGIQNVFDKSPPILATSDTINGGYSYYGDPRLRRFSLMLRRHFSGASR